MSLAFALNPAWQPSPSEFHRLLTAGWLHAVGRGGSDIVIQHILGNILVIALVGVPLEQRLGRKRFLLIYLLGVVSGNLAWWFSHWGEFGFALGASGAAFGLLGCYLACWPRDEIEFPLILIRKWPVSLIALLKVGLEIFQVGMLYSGWTSSSPIAHLAHIGGFFVCYAVGRPIARGGPTPPEINDGGPSAAAAEKGEELVRKKRMGGLKFDPWEDAGKPLSGNAEKVLQRLRAEGDELETRRAWLEELAEFANCPECGAALKVEIHDEVTQLSCSDSRKHLLWP
jgi:membrane associated rhomboid family serine protease